MPRFLFQIVLERLRIGIDRRLRQHCLRRRGITERARTGKDIRKRIPRRLHLDALPRKLRHGDIDVARVDANSRGHALHRSLLAPELAADDPRLRSVVFGHLGDGR